jgi:hypothetical protein
MRKTKARNIGNELLRGLQKLKRGTIGRVLAYPPAAKTRARAGLSHIEVARLLSLSVRTLQE